MHPLKWGQQEHPAQEFPAGLVLGICHHRCRGLGQILGQKTEILHATWTVWPKKKKCFERVANIFRLAEMAVICGR